MTGFYRDVIGLPVVDGEGSGFVILDAGGCQDPFAGRCWERTYPNGEMHGGGPPCLRTLGIAEAQRKYGAWESGAA